MSWTLKKPIKSLKKILPKISKINSENERNNLLLNINMRLSNYEEAFAITNTILEKKETTNMKNFQCLLIEVLNKPKKDIEDCYLYNANLYKKQLDNMPKMISITTKQNGLTMRAYSMQVKQNINLN